MRSIKGRWFGGVLGCEGAGERGVGGGLKPSATTHCRGTLMVREMGGRSKGEVARGSVAAGTSVAELVVKREILLPEVANIYSI